MLRFILSISLIFFNVFFINYSYAKELSAFSDKEIAIMGKDYKLCKLNSGKSDIITEDLAKDMENIYGKPYKKNLITSAQKISI